MDLPPPANESADRFVTGPSCPDATTWARIRDTAGASADSRFLGHLQRCSDCLGRLEVIAAEWSRDDLLVSAGSSAVVPALDALVERLRRDPPAVDATCPTPAIDGLDDLVEVGRGGMGVVYRAHDSRFDRTVAVKVLSSARTLSPEARQRAEREARLLDRIVHPNVVRILSVTDAHGLPAIVMEWIDGESLENLGRHGAVPLVESLRIVRDLAGAVEAMHAAGVVHRDIKPANVLIAADPEGGPGVPKLIDFGLARPEDDPGHTVTRASITVGTPAFMAPEQTGLDPALGAVGLATDIHGLGALLYWLLSGRVPYEGQTTGAVLKRAADGDVPPISSLVPRLPHDVGTIVATCLEREPGRRYRSAAALADDLSRFLDGRPILARRTGMFERGVLWARRRPVTAVVAGSGVLVAVAVLVGVGHQMRSLREARASLEAERTEAIAAAALARESFARLTDDSAKRFLGRGKPLDAADREYLVSLRDRCRDWPLDPDEEAALHFRAAGLYRLANLFEAFNWKDDCVQTCRDHRASLDELERRGLATADESARGQLLERLERGYLVDAGRIDEAIAVTRDAIARLESRVAADPLLEPQLAAAWGDLGNLEGKAGRLAESSAAQQMAIGMLDRLVAAAPSDAALSRLSLTILYNAAINPAFRGDPPTRRALITALLERAAAGTERFSTEKAEFARGFLLGLSIMAAADLEEGKPAEALVHAERRADLARQLAAEYPREPKFRDEMVSAAVQRFHCTNALGRPGDARAGLDEAEAIATEAFEEEPAVMQRSWVLAEVLAFKAMMEEATGRRDEAIVLHRRLRDLLLRWVMDDGSPEPFPIKLAHVKAQIERLEADGRSPRASAVAPGEPGDEPFPGPRPAN
jgi:tetratricopeptide (TPR) repeat protein